MGTICIQQIVFYALLIAYIYQNIIEQTCF